MTAREKTLIRGIVLTLALVFILPCMGSSSRTQAAAVTSAPAVTTLNASDVGYDKATLNGEIASIGGDDIIEYGFYYGITTSPSTKVRVGRDGISAGDSFSYDLTSLSRDFQYYFMAYATNRYGTSYGSVKSVTSTANSSDAPTVITYSATDIGDDYATLNAELTSTGGGAITEYGFYYGITSSPSTKVRVGQTGISAGENFSYDVTSLTADKRYYFQAYATNRYGTSYGSVKSFTTTSSYIDRPTVSTDSATDIGDDYATLNGEITSIGGGIITEYGFYYGTSSSPSTKVRAGRTGIAEGDSFSYDLTDLRADQRYYFRAYATNRYGISYGSVRSFTTGSGVTSKPKVTTVTPATGKGTAALYGVVTSIGGSAINSYGFYYGTNISPGTKVEAGYGDLDQDQTFSYRLTGLSPGATYYVKAYATNKAGTSYGSVLSFKVQASAAYQSVFTIGSYTYDINGSYQSSDVAPYIKNNRTYLPIRFVAYSVGITDYYIIWDETNKTVILIKDGVVVKLQLNSRVMLVNGSTVMLDTAPEIRGNRVCLPIAPVVGAFGYMATWDQYTQQVTIQ